MFKGTIPTGICVVLIYTCAGIAILFRKLLFVAVVFALPLFNHNRTTVAVDVPDGAAPFVPV